VPYRSRREGITRDLVAGATAMRRDEYREKPRRRYCFRDRGGAASVPGAHVSAPRDGIERLHRVIDLSAYGTEGQRFESSRARLDLSQEIREKDRIAIEWLITGTHKGERPELPASGSLIELQGSAFLTLKDDKIVEVCTVLMRLLL
jgi:predicted ester cyclase